MLVADTARNMSMVQAGMDSFQSVYDTMLKEALFDFEEIKVEKKYITTNEYQMMGAARITSEGAPSTAGTFNSFGQKTFTVNNITLKVGITDDLLEFNLYEDEVPQLGTAFVQSQIEALNLQGGYILSNMTSNSPTPEIGWDNMPILSSNHPYSGGVQSNTLPQAMPLHPLSINMLMNRVWMVRSANGFPVTSTYIDHMTVHPANAPNAFVLIQSRIRPGQSSFELNSINGMNYFKNGFVVNHYIVPGLYIFTSSIPGAWYFVKNAFKMGQQSNADNFVILVSCIARYVLGVDNFRRFFGAYSAPF